MKNTRKPHMIKSPLNYTGGKYKLLPQILPLFPNNINTFVDLFAGGCSVGVNAQSQKTIFNDNLTYLIDFYKTIQAFDEKETLKYIYKRINEFELSKTNQEGFNLLRNEYNKSKKPLDFFVLVAYSFNHQIRFNNKHHFNCSFGKNRSHFNSNMKKNLCEFLEAIKKIDCTFLHLSFEKFNFSSLTEEDFIYCDPPYLITTANYNDGKRGFKGWTETEEKQLLALLDNLHQKNIKFALSNVIEHENKKNQILEDWIENTKYNRYDLSFDYRNSSYQKKYRGVTKEILITNYNPRSL